MKTSTLPQHINLLRIPEQEAHFFGSLLIKDMQRLTPSLYDENGEVAVDLQLGTDVDGTRFCHVQLEASINLQCQRCMEPFTYGIISDFVHGIAHSQQDAEALSEQYEPVIAQDGLLIVQDMVEDELILKLPIVSMHADTECKVKLPVTDASWEQDEEVGQSPFHVLKLLKPETK